MKIMIIQRQQRYLVFDQQDWFKKGDIGNNSIFYKPAIVVNLDSVNGTLTADVIFECRPNKISKHHFRNGFKEIIIVICNECKSFYYKGINKCKVCGCITLTNTHIYNEEKIQKL